MTSIVGRYGREEDFGKAVLENEGHETEEHVKGLLDGSGSPIEVDSHEFYSTGTEG